MSQCDRPKPGWECYGDTGHFGPCAAWPVVVPASSFEKLIGWAVGDLLLWLSQKAKTRGDEHEFAHLRAALVAGNSEHRNGLCQLRP